MQTVDFYFDYLSPFAYLAALRVPALCARSGATVVFRPVLFAGLLNRWGQLGPAEIAPKAVHAFRSCLRHARRHGIPFRSPEYHPFNPLTALRATLAAGDRERAALALFDFGWAQGGDLGDAANIAAVLERAGLSGAALVADTSRAAVKELLARETEDAIARGVFGIPTMIVDDELYWGLDQLEHLETHLRTGNPLGGIDVASLAPRGAAAQRKRPGRAGESEP